jgi:hypothetical protein
MDQAEIQKVTRDLEGGNGNSLSDLLRGKFEEQRLDALNQIRAQNQRDMQANSSVPAIQVNFMTSFAGTNSITVSIDRHNYTDVLNGGPVLYRDSMQLRQLTHSTANDPVPPNTHQVDVRALTTNLEQGTGKGTQTALSGLFIEEKVRILDAVRRMNEGDLASGKTKIRLDIAITPDKIGDNYISINRTLPGFHDGFMGGTQIYYDSLHLPSGKRNIFENNDDRK